MRLRWNNIWSHTLCDDVCWLNAIFFSDRATSWALPKKGKVKAVPKKKSVNWWKNKYSKREVFDVWRWQYNFYVYSFSIELFSSSFSDHIIFNVQLKSLKWQQFQGSMIKEGELWTNPNISIQNTKHIRLCTIIIVIAELK